MSKRIALASFALLGLFASSAYAQQGALRYSGIGIGEVTAKLDSNLVDFDESDLGYKFFGGYLFNPYAGVEIAYWDGASPEGRYAEVQPSAFTIQGLVRLPLGDVLAVIGKVGIAFYDLDTSLGSESDNDLVYGAGISAGLGQKFELRGEWEMFDAKFDPLEGDISMLSVSAIFKF